MSDTWDFFLQRQVNQLRQELHDTEDQLERQDLLTGKALRDIRRRLYATNTVLAALVETLAAANVIDMEIFNARHENLLEAEGWSQDNPEPTTTDRPYTCQGCFKAIPIAEGNMTATGIRCKQCAKW